MFKHLTFLLLVIQLSSPLFVKTQQSYKKKVSQQFHQYEQNEQLPLTANYWTQNRPWHVCIVNTDPGLRKTQTWLILLYHFLNVPINTILLFLLLICWQHLLLIPDFFWEKLLQQKWKIQRIWVIFLWFVHIWTL